VTELDVAALRSVQSSEDADSWLDVHLQATPPTLDSPEEAGPAGGPGGQWFVSRATNWSAPCTLQAFQDPFVCFNDPYVPSTCLFLQLFAAELFAGGRSIQMERVGWAVLPVFDKRCEGYTRRGAFSVPVFAGSTIPSWVFDEIVADPTKADTLIQAMVSGTTGKKDAPHPLLVPPGEPVSVLVRIQDGQFDSILPVSTSRYSASLAPKPVRSRFLLSSRMPFHLEQPQLGTVIPKTITQEDTEACLVQAVRAIVEGRAPKTGVFSIRVPGQALRTAATALTTMAALRAMDSDGAARPNPSRAVPEPSRAVADHGSHDPFAIITSDATDAEAHSGVYGVRAFASSASDSFGEDSAAPSPTNDRRFRPGEDHGAALDFGEIQIVDPVAFHQATIEEERALPWRDSIAIRVARGLARSGIASIANRNAHNM